MTRPLPWSPGSLYRPFAVSYCSLLALPRSISPRPRLLLTLPSCPLPYPLRPLSNIRLYSLSAISQASGEQNQFPTTKKATKATKAKKAKKSKGPKKAKGPKGKGPKKNKKSKATNKGTTEMNGVRVAVEGCGHGTLDAIYESVRRACETRGWDSIDLLIIGGDFQAVRNAADLSVMSVPPKYRQLGDFPAYYSGEKKAPYLTIFIGGNHEASSHLWELYYGGWVAPNMYYMGAANVLRFGPLRIAGMSGIWKGSDYRKPHHERLPFSHGDVRSIYHVREIDVRKLLLLREQVDVGLSHDWPRTIENHGSTESLWKMKPDFEVDSIKGVLGSPAAEYVMDRLRPAYWFSAHLHCKYPAIKTYESPRIGPIQAETSTNETPVITSGEEQTAGNPDEVDLDDEDESAPAEETHKTEQPAPPPPSEVAEEVRAQLPASFAPPELRLNPGQPVPPSITNTTTRFLSLDKCLPGRKFLQVCEIEPIDQSQLALHPPSKKGRRRYRLSYDPEWLAITRALSDHLTIGDASAEVPPDLGEEAYTKLIDAERAWVDEHVVRAGKLAVPENFEITAPPHRKGLPEIVKAQPDEYTNPQTTAFCELVGVKNLWDASPEERAERQARGPPPSSGNENRGGPEGRGGGRGGRGGGRGRGGGGRGRGGFGHGRGRGRSQGGRGR